MVKEVPKEEKDTEIRKSKFTKASEEPESKPDMPLLFGKGGSKQEVEENIQHKKMKKEEGKFKMYGKALKMMKNMGFKADKGVGKNEQGQTDIIHVQKRKDNAGLGTVKERPLSMKESKDLNYDDKDPDQQDKPSKAEMLENMAKANQALKADDKNFLNFLLKTTKDTKQQKVKRTPVDNFESNFNSEVTSKQRMMKSLNIIDESGGAFSNEFIATGMVLNPNKFTLDKSMEDMRKGFLLSDRVDSKAEKSKRSKIISKYTSIKMNMKSMLQSSVNKKAYSTSQISTLENELKATKENIGLYESRLKRMEEFKTKVDALLKKTANNSYDLISNFKQFYLEISKPQESEPSKPSQLSQNSEDISKIDIFSYSKFNIITVLLKQLIPLISKEAGNIDFIDRPLAMYDTVTSFRELLLKILEDNVTSMGGDDDHSLFGNSRMLEKELENGKKIVNSYLKVLFDYIIPKLKNELSKVSNTNFPEKGLYSWLSPWLNLLEIVSQTKGIEIFSAFKVVLRLKLIQLLQNWQPHETRISSEIIKFQSIIDPKSYNSMIAQYVTPKLTHHINKLEINPQNQQIAPVQWVISWQKCVDQSMLLVLFPKLLQVLDRWVQTTNCDVEEVMEWYQGWKSIMPTIVVQSEEGQRYLRLALVIISSTL